MTTPFLQPPFAGDLGSRTVSFYRLDPTGTVPIELLGDLVPGLGPDRVTFDMIDSEDGEDTADITTHALQDFQDSSSNVHIALGRRTFSGTLVGSIEGFGVGSLPGVSGGLRSDLRRLENLRQLFIAKKPIMVISPRRGYPRAWIGSIGDSWTPELGPNTNITVSIVESRIVSKLTAGAVVQDVAASTTGNNRTNAVGRQSGKAVDTSQLQTSSTPGVAPSFGVPFA